MRLEGRSRRKEVQERCITQSPKVAAYVANIVRGKISVQGLVIGRGQGHRRDWKGGVNLALYDPLPGKGQHHATVRGTGAPSFPKRTTIDAG